MPNIICEDFQDGYIELLETLLSQSRLVGKFRTIDNLNLQLKNPQKSLIAVKKNWDWCFLEGLDRISWDVMELMNPGTAYTVRPNWKKKLSKEGGYFDYAYGIRYQSQIPVVKKKLKESERENVLSVWHEDYFTERKEYNRVPCTLTHQFVVRKEYPPLVGELQGDSMVYTVPANLEKVKFLDMYTTMRTLDAMNMMPYDVFHHTMLQRYLATETGLELGNFYLNCPIVYYQKKRDVTGSVKSTLKRLERTPKLEFEEDWKFSEIDRKKLQDFNDLTFRNIDTYREDFQGAAYTNFVNNLLMANDKNWTGTVWGKQYLEALIAIRFKHPVNLRNEFKVLNLKLLKVERD